jgi:hypothetical protein
MSSTKRAECTDICQDSVLTEKQLDDLRRCVFAAIECAEKYSRSVARATGAVHKIIAELTALDRYAEHFTVMNYAINQALLRLAGSLLLFNTVKQQFMTDALQDFWSANAIVEAATHYVRNVDIFLCYMTKKIEILRKFLDDSKAVQDPQNLQNPQGLQALQSLQALQDLHDMVGDHIEVAIVRLLNAAHNSDFTDAYNGVITLGKLDSDFTDAYNAVIKLGKLNPSIEAIVYAARLLAAKKAESAAST